MVNKIELLSPAGDLEKLKVAVVYGADAVYIGGTNFGLRARSKNFDMEDMAEGIKYAHERNVKVYITANIFAHNSDFEEMGRYFKSLEEMGADAIILSDPGVFSAAREAVPDMPIHISTQANNTNYMTVKFWKDLGASRIVLARELSLTEIKEIHDKSEGIELECFVHGAMCMAYSGRCLLSNFMLSRDANRGECAHPCRFKYRLVEETRPDEYMPVYEDDRGAYIFNSKDLCMLDNLPDVINAGVLSIKIEGRMKTPFYVASVTKTYREALDDYYKDPAVYESKKEYYLNCVKKSSHRDFTTGFYYGRPGADSHIYENNSYIRDYDFSAIVLSYDEESGCATVQQRSKFIVGDTIEFLLKKGRGFTQMVTLLTDENGVPVTEAPHPLQILKIKTEFPVSELDIMIKAL